MVIASSLVFALLSVSSAWAVLNTDAVEKKEFDQSQRLAMENAEKVINGFLQASRDGNQESASRQLAEVRKSITALNRARIPTRVQPRKLSDQQLASYLTNLPPAPERVAGFGWRFDTFFRVCTIIAATCTYYDNAHKFPLDPLPPKQRRGDFDETFN